MSKLVSRKFNVTALAIHDLLEIGRYTDKRWGIKQRNLYLKQIDEAFKLLAKNPMIGKDGSNILPGYRKYQQGSHVIYYTASVTVEIVRVLHERMDVESHFQQVRI